MYRQDPRFRKGLRVFVASGLCFLASIVIWERRGEIKILGIHIYIWMVASLILAIWGWTETEEAEAEFNLRPSRQYVPSSRSYPEYLASEEWKTKRAAALERAGYRCQVCNSSNFLEVHHRTYKDLGDEDIEDLTVLCDRCHDLFHSKIGMPDTRD